MSSESGSGPPRCRYNMREYWNKRAGFFEEDELKAVCVLKADHRLNQLYDAMQRQLFYLLLGKVGHLEKVLEVGCGVGRWGMLVQELADLYYGIDISSKMVKIAKKRLKAATAVMSAHHLGFSDQAFDVVFSITVLQHIPYSIQSQAVREMCRVTKKGGYIILIEDSVGAQTSFNLFANSLATWKTLFENNGCELVHSVHHKNRVTVALYERFVSVLDWLGLSVKNVVPIGAVLDMVFSALMPGKSDGIGLVVRRCL